MISAPHCYIFDIDGTIADLRHRLHHIQGDHRNWNAFFMAMRNDAPIWPVIDLMPKLKDEWTDILLVSGRPEDWREETEEWLHRHHVRYDRLYMRLEGDTRSDVIVKKEILDQIRAENYEIHAVIDDRPNVVKMWRSNGLTVLQNEWHGESDEVPFRAPLLQIMVGPTGAGKSRFIMENFDEDRVISTDLLRQEFCGDFRDQSRNNEVFAAAHRLIRARLWSGLDTIFDATNIRNKDRLAVVDLAPPNANIEYIVIDRPLAQKRLDGGWRNELDFDLIGKHHQTFQSNLKDILAGDRRPNVTVKDLRT